MRLLLSGGTGFFGKAFVRFWMERENTNIRPNHVFIISRDPDRFLSKNTEFKAIKWITWIKADVTTCNPYQVIRTYRGLDSVTHVLHAATESTSGPFLSNRKRFFEIVDGTRFMLSLASLIGTPRFLITSSGGVYGERSQDLPPFREDFLGMPDPLIPNNSYSIAKRAAEHLCALYSEEHNLEFIIARCFAFVGEDLPLNAHFAVGNFIRDALWDDKLVINSDGQAKRSYLDQRDLANWITTLLRSGRSGQAYNVGSDRAITILDLACLVSALVGGNKPVSILGKYDKKSGRNFYVPDVSKVRHEFNLVSNYSLEEAILHTAFVAKSRNSASGIRS